MNQSRIERIKEIIKTNDTELMEARKKVFPTEYAAAEKEIAQEAQGQTVSVKEDGTAE